MTPLAGWENFYVIVGSSAGALIGLQFVVITLVSNRPIGPGQAEAGAAFATPSVVHFGTVLLVSAVLCGLVGLGGIVYEIVVTRRMRVQTAYQPELEDWLFHGLLPFVAYATLAASAYAARPHARQALFGVAAAALLLLFIGIHNAWDSVVYHVFVMRRKQAEAEPRRDRQVAEK